MVIKRDRRVEILAKAHLELSCIMGISSTSRVPMLPPSLSKPIQVIQPHISASQALESHRAARREAGRQRFRSRLQPLGHIGDGPPEHHMALEVQAPAACPAGHLQQLGAIQQPQAVTVALALAVDEHAAGGHVDAHGQGLGGEQELQQAALEEELHEGLVKQQMAWHGTIIKAWERERHLKPGPLGRHLPCMVCREALKQGQRGVPRQGQVLGADSKGLELRWTCSKTSQTRWKRHEIA